jgi:MFS transporter, DHA3 family, macrolide efflux protein
MTSEQGHDVDAADERVDRAATLGRRFWIVWIGQTASVVGSSVSGMGAAIFVYLETGSIGWLSALAALAAVPAVAALPVLGRLDRWSRRAVMLVADTTAALATATACVLVVTGRLAPGHLVALAVIGGTANAFQGPAYQAAIPALAPPAALGRANGLVQLGPAVGIVIGPAIASALMVWKGIGAVLVFDLVTFALAVVGTVMVRLPILPAVARSDSGWRPALEFLRGPGRTLLRLIMAVALVNLVLGGYNVALLALGLELGGVGRVGLLTAIAGSAMVASSLVMGARGIPARRGRALVTSLAVMGGFTVVGVVRPSFWLLVVGVAGALGTVPVANAITSTVFHERVPAHLQGRVFALRSGLGQGLLPIGSVMVGVLTARILEPAMDRDGWLGGSLGRVVGAGAERAPAVAVIVVGLGLSALAVWLWRSGVARVLDDTPATTAADGTAAMPLTAAASTAGG